MSGGWLLSRWIACSGYIAIAWNRAERPDCPRKAVVRAPTKHFTLKTSPPKQDCNGSWRYSDATPCSAAPRQTNRRLLRCCWHRSAPSGRSRASFEQLGKELLASYIDSHCFDCLRVSSAKRGGHWSARVYWLCLISCESVAFPFRRMRALSRTTALRLGATMPSSSIRQPRNASAARIRALPRFGRSICEDRILRAGRRSEIESG